MRYGTTVWGEFVSRPNRFVAEVLVDGEPEAVHVKNTGRCRELLVPGAPVVLSDSGNPDRRHRYDLVAVRKGDLLVNMDSQAPNAVFAEYLRAGGMFGGSPFRREAVHGDSRFDFLVDTGGQGTFVEVKGVTLERDGVCMFPDAPTARGAKHLRGLAGCVSEGYGAAAVFVVQMEGMRGFEPNAETDPVFARSLAEAEEAGVRVECLGCRVTEDSIEIAGPVPRIARTRPPPSRCTCRGPAP